MIKIVSNPEYITCDKRAHWDLWTKLPGRCFVTLGELSKWVFVTSYFRGRNYHPDLFAHFLLEIRWRLCFSDAKPSSNFLHKLGYRSDIMDTSSTNLQPHNNAFGELTKCSEAPTRSTNCRSVLYLPSTMYIAINIYAIDRMSSVPP